MRIAQIIPGSGGSFYCQNCLRDSTLVRQLRNQGHDVFLVPMYLPMAGDEPQGESSPVFYGAISLYLRQQLPLLRRAPRLLDRLLDSRPLLRLAARMAGSTRAAGLEEMTLSMLQGEHGNQAAELEHLISWLNDAGKPDIVHISNALLLGLAGPIRRRVGVPVVCSLQDEDKWVDDMGEQHAARVWSLMAEKAREVDAFLAVSKFYAELMAERLQIDGQRLHVVHLGIDTDGYRQAAIAADPPVIGYLSRLCQSLGLGVLVDAFIKLRREDDRLGNLQLKVAGGSTTDDRRFLGSLKRKLRRLGLLDDVHFLPVFARDDRIELLASLTALSVPVAGGEAFGTYLLEAMAAGVPVVQPATGAFPELIELTGGGIVYPGDDADALAAALGPLLLDRQQACRLGQQGRDSVLSGFSIARMADRTTEVYEAVLQGSPVSVAAS